MRKNVKQFLTFFLLSTFITAISASEPVKKEKPVQAERQKMIITNAMIEDDFSGLEIVPIVSAFMSWASVTHGDITILPPTENDGIFYDAIMKGSSKSNKIFEASVGSDGKTPDPWAAGCRHTFFVIRTNSTSEIVRALDGETRQILAFTFTGCMVKFIVIVADRMRDEQVLYATMLHELGHMWGLPDNKEGQKSVMNGEYPTAGCITKRDIANVYEAHRMSKMTPQDTGCEPHEQNEIE